MRHWECGLEKVLKINITFRFIFREMNMKPKIFQFRLKNLPALLFGAHLLFAGLIGSNVFGQSPAWTIEVKGAVTEYNRKLAGAVITVFANNSPVNTINSRDGKFDFNLSPDNDYTITFTKPGYITKRISFSTKNVPDERGKHGFDPYTSISEVDIIPLMKGGDFESRADQLLLQPVAKVAYSPTLNGGKGDFTYDADYSASMREKLQKIIDDYEAFNTRYKEQIRKADGEFRDKNYTDAKTDYKAALTLKPDEQYPKDMIAKCNDALKKPNESTIKSSVQQPVKPVKKAEPVKKETTQKEPASAPAPVPVKAAAPPVHVNVCPCIMSRINDSCRKYLKPFFYDDANTLHLQPRTFVQVREINFPGFSGQRFRIVIDIAAMPPGTVVTVYDQDNNHKNRKPLYSISDSENRIGFVDAVCKGGRFYVEYRIPATGSEMCAVVMFGYENK